MLRWSGLGAARLLVGCGDNDLVRDPGTQLATAIVEPDSNSFLVSVWAGLSTSVALEVQARDVVISRTSVDVDDTARAVFSVEGLEPATSYDVSVVTDTGARMLHQVRTAPRDDDDRPVRFAIGADIDTSSEFQTDLMEQMVALGRGLMAQPDVLAIDEMSLGLAPLVVRDIGRKLKELNGSRGLAVLLVEQNARLALSLCDMAYVLETGRLVAQGRCDQLIKSPLVLEAYLGSQPGAAS
jgi:hypothetical protein